MKILGRDRGFNYCNDRMAITADRGSWKQVFINFCVESIISPFISEETFSFCLKSTIFVKIIVYQKSARIKS